MAENGLLDDFLECPLCMEPLALDDINFYPCACRYQICRFCWHRIRTDENGLCPHCREPYSENPAEYTPPTQEQMAKLKSEKKQKNVEKRQKIIESRKSLASVRVVQKNLVFVIGLSPRLADPEVLKKNEYFGKFGRIYKVVINNHTVYNGAQGPSVSAYVTYVKNEDASKAITAVNNAYIDGRHLKASFGTTKYCTSFLRGMPCSKPDCMYLHELGDDDASFTKEDMQLGKHQVYETATLAAANVPASFKDMQQKESVVMGTTGGGVKIKHVTHNKPAAATDTAESALPATASWGSSVKTSTNPSGSLETIPQQVPAKDTKTNSNSTLSHSHSIGATTRHKHQQLHKSHSHSPSHSTGAIHTSSSSHSRSSSNKLASKELSASHHSQTKSDPLSPTHNNELSTSTSGKKQQSSNSGHNRSNSSSKSTSSLSPKSTLSGSSSSGSLKHDVDNELATNEARSGSGDITVEGEGGSEEPSLNSSREEGDGDDVIDDNERGEGEAAERGGEMGGWCQIKEMTDSRRTVAVTENDSLYQSEGKETEEVVAPVVVGEGPREEEDKKEGDNLTVVGEGPLSEEPKATEPTKTASQQQQKAKEGETEDSSIVKVIPSFVGGAGQFGSLGVSWNTALPQHLSPSPSPSSAATDSTHNQATATPAVNEDVATPTGSSHHEDDLGFDPWDVSQQGLADLMKSEQHQSRQHGSAPAPSIGGMPLSNGIGGNGGKSSLVQEEFRALFPSANVSFEGPNFGPVGGSSDTLLSSASSSKPVGAIPTPSPAAAASSSTSSYVPSRLDSALSSTYHPLLGTSPMPPITSSSSSISTSGGGSGSLSMFLGQHQPGFPSSSIKVHPRSSPAVASSIPSSQQQSVGSKLASAEWPDLGVSITSKSSAPGQWLPTTSDSTDSSTNRDSSVPGSTATTTASSSTLPPPPPGFTAKTTPTPGSAYPATAVSSSGSAASASARAPGATLNNTVNHSMWTGSVGNVKGNITSNHLLQSWANFINFSSLSPAQQQQLARGSQIYQQLLIQQQYLIRQSLLVQSNPYYQAHAQALAQAQATLRAQLQQNVLKQQQVAATIRAIAGLKIANSAPSSTAVSTSSGSSVGGSSVAGGGSSTSGGSVGVPVCHSGTTAVQQTHTQHSVKTFPNLEVTAPASAAKTSKHGVSSEGVAAHHTQRHVQQQQQQQASMSKHQQHQGRTVPSSKQTAIVGASKHSASNGPHSNTSSQTGQGSSDRKTVRLKAK